MKYTMHITERIRAYAAVFLIMAVIAGGSRVFAAEGSPRIPEGNGPAGEELSESADSVGILLLNTDADADSDASDITVLDITDSDTTDSDTADSDAADSDTTDSDTSDSDAADSDAADSDTADSDTTDPDTADSDTTDPDTTDSDTIDSDTTDPDTTDSDTIDSDTIDSDTREPITEPPETDRPPVEHFQKADQYGGEVTISANPPDPLAMRETDTTTSAGRPPLSSDTGGQTIPSDPDEETHSSPIDIWEPETGEAASDTETPPDGETRPHSNSPAFLIGTTVAAGVITALLLILRRFRTGA